MSEHLKYTRNEYVECPICLGSAWFLERTGRVLCGHCAQEHANLAWYDDDADVIAQVCGDALDSAPNPPSGTAQ